jgi:curved DNA-binding protein CbpA
VIDPYDMLGVGSDADEAAIRTAFRRLAKSSHPDSGGDAEAFVMAQKAQDLLLDPLRRKVFDATGYDPELADARDLQGLMIIEKLVNDIVLDEREPGTFDPLDRMRTTLRNDIRKARFHATEMEGHGARVGRHLDRLGTRPAADVLGYMLRARIDAISKAVVEARKQVEANERALEMLESYRYEMDAPGVAEITSAPTAVSR